MQFELRIDGRPEARYASADEAEARARELLHENADREVAIIDLSTGRPYAPGADEASRAELSRKIGF